jgi:pullulanase
MIAEGQEYIRSKRGISNTYNRGDDINALNWTERDRPIARTTQDYYRSLIHLRRGKAGASFRLAEAPPENYYRWIWPESEQAFGYIVNAPQAHDGAGFIVLLNAGTEPVTFSVPVPEGRWRMISDGTNVELDGIPDTPEISGARTLRIRVPAVRSAILMNGF